MTNPAESGAHGCHPLLVCTDRPELCPPACTPVVRNAGTNETPSRFCGACGVAVGLHDGMGTCELADRRASQMPGSPEAWRRPIPPAETGGAS